MINLKNKGLPDTVTVDGKPFFINTDYRLWLRFLSDVKKSATFPCGYLFRGEAPQKALISELMEFARPKNELPRQISHSDAILLDFDIDADYIYAAFLQCYNIDLLEVDMHWHKFLALLNGISGDTTLAKIMSYRAYRKQSGNKDYMEELRRAWEIEEPLTEEEKKELEEFENLFI